MAEGKKQVRLYYGAARRSIFPSIRPDLLDEYSGEAGTIRLNVGNDKWLTIAVGPGIPIAVSEWVQVPMRVGNVR